jgi:hypothetical protein
VINQGIETITSRVDGSNEQRAAHVAKLLGQESRTLDFNHPELEEGAFFGTVSRFSTFIQASSRIGHFD